MRFFRKMTKNEQSRVVTINPYTKIAELEKENKKLRFQLMIAMRH